MENETKKDRKVRMLLYGDVGIGKSTFAAKIPNALIIDFENGYEYIDGKERVADVKSILDYPDKNGFDELYKLIEKYDTIVIDTISNMCEVAKGHLSELPPEKGEPRNTRIDGSPSQSGWGWVIFSVHQFINRLIRMDKNLIIIAHEKEVDEKEKARLNITEEYTTVPLLSPKSLESIISSKVNIVSAMIPEKGTGKPKILCVKGTRYKCKDRTKRFAKISSDGKPVLYEPDFNEIKKVVNSDNV